MTVEPSDPPRAARRLRGRRAWAAAAVALAALALVPLLFRGSAVPVRRAEVRAIEQKLVASGRVLPPARIRLGTTVLGTVGAVAADEGDEVAAGAMLARLDDREARGDVAQARAGVAEARARLEGVRRVSSPVAAGELLRAGAALEQAERELERARALAASGGIARRDLEEAERAVDVAQSRRDDAAARAASSREGADVRLAAASLVRAEAALEAAEARLARTVLAAPADATVLERHAEVGDVVQPGAVLFVLARRGETRLEVEPDEKSLALLRVGQEGLASADAFPGERFRATVRRIAPAVDPDRGTVRVELLVPEPPAYLRPDMAVSVEIAAGARDGATVLPAEAVRDLGTEAPWVLAIERGVAVRRPVVLGLRGEGAVEVVRGLAIGEAAILPSARIAPGERVRARD
jgi:HlyD family secretion protein